MFRAFWNGGGYEVCLQRGGGSHPWRCRPRSWAVGGLGSSQGREARAGIPGGTAGVCSRGEWPGAGVPRNTGRAHVPSTGPGQPYPTSGGPSKWQVS